ncbi:MAG: redoxin domain-containing protein [Alphaproteobacteria bacterium]|nr:redoxin domain-containing protein [Alphaproteobacteria bacterium]
MRQFLLTSLAVFAIAITAIVSLSTASKAAAPEIGKAAPDFTATDINGDTFKLSDHKGKIVVLEWSNHECPFVVKHYGSGNMQKVQKETTEKGVEWVTIVSSADGRQGNTTAEEAAKIIEEQGAHPSVKILDASGEIGKMYDAKTTPHMFVINTDGTLAYAGAIDNNPSPNPATIEGAENYVTAAVDELIEGKDVTTSQTQPYGCSVKYAY